MENIGYSVLGVIALIIVFLLIKKVASCLIKSIIFILALAVLAAIYYMYMR